MADSTSADSYRKPNSIEQREDYRRQPPSRSRSRSRSRSPPPRSSNNGSGRRRPSPRPRRRQSPEYTSRRREEQEDDRRYRDQQRSRNRDRDRDRDSYSYNRDRRDSRRDRDRSFRDGPPASSSSKPPVQEKESGPGGPSQGSIKQLKAPMAAVSMIEVEANDRLGGKVRVKCSPSDTIGDLKKLIAAQKGTKPEKIVLKKWYTIYKDHISLSDYEIHNGMSLEMH